MILSKKNLPIIDFRQKLNDIGFADGLLSSGFTKVDYVGAFSTNDNWLDGWTEFDPQSTEY